MRNLFLIYILFFSFFATLNAQDKKIDSLLSQIKSSEGQSKVKSLLELTNYYHKQNEEQSLKYAKEALKESQRIKYTYGEIDALSNMALSNIYLTEYENALNYSLEALKKAEAEKNESQCAECYSLLGHAYLNMSNFTLADQNFNKALQLYIKLDDKLNIATMYNNIAVSFDNRNILDSALKYYQIAFPIYETLEKNNDLYKGLWYTNVGDLYRKQGKNREALEMQLKAEPLLINANDQHTLLVLYSGMPYTFIEGKQYDKALYYALKAVELGKKLNVKRELAYAHLAVADVYGEKNDFKNQVIYLQRYIELSDSLFLDETSRSITEMQSKYESEKKEKAIELLNKNKALQEAEIEKHKSKQIFYIGVVIFVLALSITLAVGIKNKNQANKILSQQKIEIQNQKHLVDEKQKEIIDSINYAKRLQTAILATRDDINKAIPNNFLFYQPKDIVAGDFYFFETTDTHIFYAAADCTGHGVPGALVSVVCSDILSRCVLEFKLTDPAKILDKTRELVLATFAKSNSDVKDGMDISFISINKITKEIKWSGANNPLWYITSDASTLREPKGSAVEVNEMEIEALEASMHEIKANKQPIGKVDNPIPFASHIIPNAEGTIFYLFTDGFADQFGGEKGKKFKYKQLKQILQNNSHLPFKEQEVLLKKTFEIWQGKLEQVDDVCIIGFRL